MNIARILATAVALTIVGTTVGAQQVPDLPLASRCKSKNEVLGFDYPAGLVTVTGTVGMPMEQIGTDSTSCEMALGITPARSGISPDLDRDPNQDTVEWVLVLFARDNSLLRAFPVGSQVQVTGYATTIRRFGPDMTIFILPTSATAL